MSDLDPQPVKLTHAAVATLKSHGVEYPWSVFDTLRIARELDQVRERQQELLEVIWKLGRDAITTSEAEELQGQIAVLIAKVGTLRVAPRCTIDLAELSNELRTQDNLATAHPVYLVQQKRRIWGMDSGYTDEYVWSFVDDPEYTFSEDEIDGEIRNYVAASESAELLKLLQAQGDDIEPEAWGYEQVHYIDIWVYVTAHLTRRAAQRYLDSNAHNLTEPRIFVESQYRCTEWNAVTDWLKSRGE